MRPLLASDATRMEAAGGETGARPLAVVLSLLTLSAFLTQFVFRDADDNRLTSWQWVFADGDLLRMSGLLLIGIGLAYALSGVSLSRRGAAVALSLASFLVAAPFWREPELIVDAARYFTQAKHLETYGIGYFITEWGRETPAWTDLPLVPFLFGTIFTLWGEARPAIQVFTTLLFSGTVAVTYLLGKALWDETVGLHAAALLLGMPYLLTQVPLMLVDVPTMFFLTLAVFTAVKALGQGGIGWMSAASAAVACALLSKYSTWPLLAVGLVVVAIGVRRHPGTVLRRAACVFLPPAVLVGALMLVKSDVVAGQLGLLWSYQLPGLARWRESLASTFLFQVHPFISLAALASVAVAVKKRDGKFLVPASLLLLVVLSRVERIRYLLVVLPMVALMASYGLREVTPSRIRRFTTCAVVVSALIVAVFGYLPHLMRVSAVNLKEAGEHLNSLETDAVEVLALPQARAGINPLMSVPLLDLFTSKRIVAGDLPVAAPPGTDASPLRFTWEYRRPGYYAAPAAGLNGDVPVVVILPDADQPLPEAVERRVRGYRLSKAFESADGWFQYRTLVRIYEPPGGPSPGGRR